MNITIRQEQPSDYKVTEDVVQKVFANMAFSDKTEHELVGRLRKSDAFIPQLSIVAVDNDEVIGHILLTKINIIHEDQSSKSLALAPVSVLPEYQNKGISKLLINTSLEKAIELGYNSVVVLGHPDYYPKFEFKKASTGKIKAPFDVPDEAFMALELSDNALSNVSGVVEYSSAFFG
ncbi:N-acetyltransferase [Viridibacillus arvi]|uniref:GNAT family N-acetyltransferase n=1 Tax=Viridibacillus arvi TaxID=263475 RepID=UPI003D2CC54F